ncbi:MAG: FKBP-type peptidyl-prolyl cis-trans isomerase [Candidatus Absconditabacteria bacterium]
MKKILLIGIIAFSVLSLSGCGNNNGKDNSRENSSVLNSNNKEMVKEGDFVLVDYVGKLDDGTVFDTSIEQAAKDAGIYNQQRPYEPLEFQAGSGQLIKGFDQGVLGMKLGETKDLTINPQDGYGEADPSKILKLSVGSGTQIGGYSFALSKIDGKNATLDFNHQLAGKKLVFDVTIIEKVNGTGEEIVAGDTIKVDYVGRLEDGTLFDTSIEEIAKQGGQYVLGRPYEPLEFTVGAGQMIKGFDSGVVGMKIGEKKTMTLNPEDAYGQANPEYFKEYSQGAQITLLPGAPTISQVGEDFIEVDMNHFLAGKTLIFQVTVKEIK